jgi:thiosulfate/3-mercaptopyruvate sulfurtransferase
MPSTLVSPEDLASRLGDPAWAVIDCRFDLADTTWGEREYLDAHIPGALYAHLGRDLSGRPTGANGRHPLPRLEDLAKTLGRWGIDETVQVIAYDQGLGMYASRLWWLLRYVGHDAVAVLDGGWATWIAESRPATAGREWRVPRRFAARARTRMVAAVDEVEGLVGDRGVRLVDARAPERYRGEDEPLDPVAGHIPGAVNHHYQANLDTNGRFLPVGELRRRLAAVLGGVAPDHVIAYCGSGVTACHNLLALEHAGLRGARLYAGSWSEWCSDPGRPVARGEEAGA